MSDREKLAVRLEPETRERLERCYAMDGSSSRREFIEKAIRFYMDYLEMNDGNALLPKEIASAIDGRLGMFEDRMASLLYKQSVEIDMTNGIIATAYDIGEDALRRMRAQSVRNVKETNGRISFEQRMRDAGDE
ncbi:hypothetical protein SDC9_150732 [bioreactor metagenome]|jgi:metal-responsive CopG/Arc/MetJ family transcriptional regulator|uniref:Ribbon-helix-helix protein CopG domain-containing protein n=1 Tax=bioreactor metagenome TaxID=1076179 RepID=A0A645EQF7_9ZZZZ